MSETYPDVPEQVVELLRDCKNRLEEVINSMHYRNSGSQYVDFAQFEMANITGELSYITGILKSIVNLGDEKRKYENENDRGEVNKNE